MALRRTFFAGLSFAVSGKWHSAEPIDVFPNPCVLILVGIEPLGQEPIVIGPTPWACLAAAGASGPTVRLADCSYLLHFNVTGSHGPPLVEKQYLSATTSRSSN